MKVVRQLENFCYERFVVVYPEEEKALGAFRAAFHYVKSAHKRDGEGYLISDSNDRTRCNGFQVKKEQNY